jgi:hypothetical protein
MGVMSSGLMNRSTARIRSIVLSMGRFFHESEGTAAVKGAE